MDLKTVKSKIKIVSADEGLNKRVYVMVMKPTDCFGVDYVVDHEECSRCVILADVDGMRLPLWNFCKEIVDERNEKMEKDKLRKIEIQETPEPIAPESQVVSATPSDGYTGSEAEGRTKEEIDQMVKNTIEKAYDAERNDVEKVIEKACAGCLGEETVPVTPIANLPPLEIPKPKKVRGRKVRKIKDPNENPNLKLKISPEIEEWTKQQILAGRKNREFASELQGLLRKDPRVIEKNRDDVWIRKQGERVCWVVARKHNLRPTNKEKRAKKIASASGTTI